MRQSPEVICAGMAVADILVKGMGQMPKEGLTSFAQEIEMHTGGDAVNEAVTLAGLGHDTGLLTLVGNDVQGTFIRENCSLNGVNTEGIMVSSVYPTSTSIVLISENGERSFISRKGGTADEFSLQDVRLDMIREGVRVVSIASLFCSERLNDIEYAAILKKAKAAGAVTIADLVLNREECTLEELKGSLPLLDYIVPSREEAEHFTGRKELSEIAEVFHGYGVENVVIKLGAEGVYADTPKERVRVQSYAAEVVDTTGAGDNFMAGFISGLVRGCSLRECLEFGSAVSAVSIGQIGATGAVKSAAQVQEIVDRERQGGIRK